ncbi:potassium voltage-gated channel protein Shaw-like [Babylonia areolata]|uniref:potassium voltage-gated channel protein Shaw-like n=1 Tax=Babylonia areolata TaxID=304850 RepID=UPI003FD60C77
MAAPCRIRLNVGGKLFMTTADTLRSLPDSRLGRLASDDSITSQQDVELFFDRNPKVMNSILDLYRTGELHIPKNLCAKTVEKELEFWEVPVELIQECCFQEFQEHKEGVAITAEIERLLRLPCDSAADCKRLTSSGRIWMMMERISYCPASKVWGLIYFAVVAFSAVLYCVDTVMDTRHVNPVFLEELARQNVSLEDRLSSMTIMEQFFVTARDPWLSVSMDLVFCFFLLEFLVRFVTCPSKGFFVKQARNQLEMFLLLHNAVALIVENFYMEGRFEYRKPVMDAFVFFYSFDVLKMLRILYIIKDFDILKILLLSVKASLKVLVLLTVCMLSLASLYGTALYLVELLTDQYTFHTIPDGMWYAVVTMTTVGYGDVVPQGTVGRMLGMLCAFSGLVTVALPVAVVASTFTKYHDNLACRAQLRRRLAFLKERPHFLLRKDKMPRDVDEPHLLFQTTSSKSRQRFSGGPTATEMQPTDTDCLM